MAPKQTMTAAEARSLRAEIRDVWGLHCVIPRGTHVCRILTSASASGVMDFATRAEADAYRLERIREKLARTRRTPLDAMIDQACGLIGSGTD